MGRIEASLQTELFKWLVRSESLWRQKSRELWLKAGDKNSSFFHLSTIIQRRHNNIDAIKADDGTWINGSKNIKQFFLDKFRELFSEEEVDFLDQLEGLIHPSISKEDNERLCAIPTPKDIRATLFMMQDLKAPSPDGFPMAFYKTYWPIVGENLTQAVISFFICGSMPKEINNFLIVLIPKVTAPLTFNNYHLISLCNVVYKVISKILVSRIRPLLPKLISPSQSVFILNRWIIEN